MPPTSDEAPLTPLLPVLRDLLAWLQAANVPAAVIGAVAASLQGRARTTKDIDLLVRLRKQDEQDFVLLGKRFGFRTRIPNALEFAAKSNVLLFVHTRTQTPLDMSIAILPFEKEVLARARHFTLEGTRIPLATPEDLIVMKAIAGRPQDLADIASLLDANPKLDRRRIRRIVREIALLLEVPEIEMELEKLFTRRSGTGWATARGAKKKKKKKKKRK